MKEPTLLIVVLSVVSLFVGCSKHVPAAAKPKATDWGVIEVSNGVPSRLTLADGRVCTVTPTIMPGGHKVELVTAITNTDAAKTRHVYSLTSYFTPNEHTTFVFDQSNIVSLTLHIPQ